MMLEKLQQVAWGQIKNRSAFNQPELGFIYVRGLRDASNASPVWSTLTRQGLIEWVPALGHGMYTAQITPLGRDYLKKTAADN